MNAAELISKMTLQEKASLLSGGDFWHTQAVDRLGIKGYMMCDGPNGLRKQEGDPDHLGKKESIKTVCYPSANTLASSFDVDMEKKLGERLGEECIREHISMLLGPGLNMKRSPVCGRNFEYFSEDPYLAGKLAASFVKGVQSKGVAACPKHFATNNQEYRRMSGNSIVDERTLHEIYLQAFEILVKEAHPKSIMCAYNQLNGTYLSENKYMLTDVLRDKWGFDGFVVTDWGAGKGPAKGVQAGLDLVMPGGHEDHEKAIIAAVEAGELDEALVDKAVAHILNVFFWNEESVPADPKPSDEATRAADYALAKELAENSAVLLKNDRVLPLKDDKKVLFVGTPCQVAGLRSFLNKDYDTLILVEILCHGVPSNKLFKSHVESIEKQFGKKAVNYSFRNKRFSWWTHGIAEVTFEDGKSCSNYDTQSFIDMFQRNLTLRESCYYCPYKKEDRGADITLGDCWDSELTSDQKKEGVSLVLINTQKGITFLHDIENESDFKEHDISYWERLCSKATRMPKTDREQMWNIYSSNGYSELADKYYSNDVKKKIKFSVKKILARSYH